VSESGYDVARLAELERLPVLDGELFWRPIRRRFGITSFGVNAYSAEEAGARVVEEHTERTNRHQELYVVVAGRAIFTLDEDEVDVPSGTFVFLRDPDVRRGAVAAEPGTVVLAIGATPGVAYEPSVWETYFAAYAYRALGDAERGRRILQEAVERDPDRAVLHYHLACFESLDGNHDSALHHVERAVELDPDVARWAASDSDLDAIRSDPRFPSGAGIPDARGSG
jgi:tetratricopeptide (TPR) repeat protein